MNNIFNISSDAEENQNRMFFEKSKYFFLKNNVF